MLQDHLLAIAQKVQEQHVKAPLKQHNVVLLIKDQVLLQKAEAVQAPQKQDQHQVDHVEDKNIDFWLVSSGSPLLQIAMGTSPFYTLSRKHKKPYNLRFEYCISNIDTLRIFRV